MKAQEQPKPLRFGHGLAKTNLAPCVKLPSTTCQLSRLVYSFHTLSTAQFGYHAGKIKLSHKMHYFIIELLIPEYKLKICLLHSRC